MIVIQLVWFQVTDIYLNRVITLEPVLSALPPFVLVPESLNVFRVVPYLIAFDAYAC